jgi:hypothetical protein
MADRFEVFFNDGTLMAAYPDGPALAGGQLGVQAYRFLFSLRDVAGGLLVMRTRVLGAAAEISFRGCQLRIVNSLILNPAAGDFRAGVPQVQPYEGPLLLTWQASNLVRPMQFRALVPWHGQPGQTELDGRLTLTYPPAPNADIAGSGSGRPLRPGLLGARPNLTATFQSRVPARPNEFIAEFAVSNFVLRGAIGQFPRLRLPPGVRVPRIPR